MDSQTSNGTILVIDDDEVTRRLIREVLEQSGFEILEASNGDEAIRVAEKYLELLDLIICDVVLPQTIGTLVAKRLTALRPDLKVLFVSGLTDVSTYGLTHANYLKKPFNSLELVQKVHQLLSDGTKG
jgi:two-component system cell cycle sensor histidine kinase/response regulator CckA